MTDRSLLLAMLGLVLLAGCRTEAPRSADTLLFGGTILTMDPAAPEVEALVIRADTVAAVGTRADLEARFPEARRYDVQGRTVLPGFIDSHAHVHELGHDRHKADLTGTATVEEMIARLQARYPAPDAGRWLVGAGWDEGAWASEGYPDRGALDDAFPDNPVALESLHGFAGFYNAAALAAAGLDAATPDPAAGTILRRADGTPTGVLLTLAQRLVDRHIPPETLEEAEAAILLGLETMAKAGVTSVHEAGMGPLALRAFEALAAAGRLPIRVYGMLDGNDEALMTAWFEHGPRRDPDAFFTVRAIKVFYDGSLGSRTALLRAPYADAPEAARPTERIPPARIAALAAQAAAGGFQMAVHAIGDEANDRVLALYEKALRDVPDRDHRWRIEHAQVVLPDYYARAAGLGVLSSMQPGHAVGDSRWAEDRLGPQRIRHAYAWRRILEAGGTLIFNSDLPGEPWTPLETLYFAVTRKDLQGTPPGGWYADQAVTVDEALRAMTRAGAYAAFQDGRVGTLTPGAFADVVELDRDPHRVPPDSLKTLSVVRTWVAGRLVVDHSPAQ